MEPLPNRDRLDLFLRGALPAGTRLWIGGHDTTARRTIAPYLANYERPTGGALDAMIITSLDDDEVCYFIRKHAHRLHRDGRVFLIRSSPPGEPEVAPPPTPAQMLEPLGWQIESAPQSLSGIVLTILARPQRG